MAAGFTPARMIAIYCIRHRASGKRYVGKSINVEARLRAHASTLKRSPRHKNCNPHLWAAVQRYGWSAFETEVLEQFDHIDEALIAQRELIWIDYFRTTDRHFGYNLRRDSSTGMVVHPETRKRMSRATRGTLNPNFGKTWSAQRRREMADHKREQHRAGGSYDAQWRERVGRASREQWSDFDRRRKMGQTVSRVKQKYDYLQFDREGKLLRRWGSIAEIVSENPDFKWQNIYNVCHGHKPTYRGFIWRQELKAERIAA